LDVFAEKGIKTEKVEDVLGTFAEDGIRLLESDEQQRVLVVEDDLSQARLIELIFQHSELPIDLHIANTLAEANTLLDSITFDLVITDLNLPDGLGTAMLPDNPMNMTFPVILLTGQGDEDVAVRAIKSGAFDYIVKTDDSIRALPNTAVRVLREWGNVLLRREMEKTLRQKQLELEEKHHELQELFKQVSQGKREWELTIDRVNDLIIRTDEQGKIRRVNRAVIELTGLSFLDLTGMQISEVFSDLSVDMIEHNKIEIHHKPTGRVFVLSSYCLDDTEIGSGMVIAAHEYTAISELNKRLSESNLELGQKSTELEKAYQDLKNTQIKVLHQEKMATVGQLAAGVAHEINNPMGYILSNLCTLDKYLTKLTDYMISHDESFSRVANPEQLSALEKKKKEINLDFILNDIGDLVRESLEGAERVRRIVSDLKGFSHQSKDTVELTDINRMIEGLIPIVWNEIKYKATLKRDFGGLPQIYCRQRLIGQVIINLLINAVQSIDKQGVITLSTWHENGTVSISVADTGCGISEEIAKKIMDPFFTTKEVGVGTGLGLSISYDIIKQHGGELIVDSVLGAGSTFTVCLPVEPVSDDGVSVAITGVSHGIDNQSVTDSP